MQIKGVTKRRRAGRSHLSTSVALVGALALVLAACGDDADTADDDADAADTEDVDDVDDGDEDDEDAGGAEGLEDEDASPDELDDDFPPDPLRVVIPVNPGGGTDTGLRQIQGPFQDALGVNISIDYLPGASHAIGTQSFINAGDECETILAAPTPHQQWSWLVQDTEYTYDDFRPLGTYFADAGIIRVANDAPWETIEEFVDDAVENPGEISVSTSGFANPHYVGMLNIMEETGAEFNMVEYDGGNDARTAVVAGEVDATHAGVFNSLHVEEDTRVIAVHQDENRWEDLTDDAPSLNEALGIDAGEMSSTHTMWASTTCYEEHPERYDYISQAMETAVTSDEHFEAMEELGEETKIDWNDPDEFHEEQLQQIEDLEEIIEQFPDTFVLEDE